MTKDSSSTGAGPRSRSHYCAADRCDPGVVDDGVPFDPRSVPDPPPASSDRAGGAAFDMVRNLMDELSYRRANCRKHTTLTEEAHYWGRSRQRVTMANGNVLRMSEIREAGVYVVALEGRVDSTNADDAMTRLRN